MIVVHSFPVAMLKNEATINQDLKAIRLSMPFNPEFLLAALVGQKKHVLSLVETSAHGTKRLSAQGIEQIQILNPPLELQQTFATRVAAVERLKERHRTQLAELSWTPSSRPCNTARLPGICDGQPPPTLDSRPRTVISCNHIGYMIWS